MDLPAVKTPPEHSPGGILSTPVKTEKNRNPPALFFLFRPARFLALPPLGTPPYVKHILSEKQRQHNVHHLKARPVIRQPFRPARRGALPPLGTPPYFLSEKQSQYNVHHCTSASRHSVAPMGHDPMAPPSEGDTNGWDLLHPCARVT